MRMLKECLTPTRKDYITMPHLNLVLNWIAQGVVLYL